MFKWLVILRFYFDHRHSHNFFSPRPSEIEKTSKDVDGSIKNPFGCNEKKLRTLYSVLEA